MKKLKIVSLVLGLSVIFAACSNGGGDSGDSSEKIYTIPDNVKSFTFSDSDEGKDCFVVYSNVQSQPQYKAQNSIDFNKYDAETTEELNNKELTLYKRAMKFRDGSYRDELHFNYENLPDINSKNYRAAQPYEGIENYYNDHSDNKFYVMSDDLAEPKLKEFELKITGDHCRIWVIKNDPYLNDNTDFSSLKNAIDSVFVKETSIFGSNLVNGGNFAITTNKNTKLDILIYDITGDGVDNPEAGIYGYFRPLDFYQNDYIVTQGYGSATSNECQVINADSYFLKCDLDGYEDSNGNNIKTHKVESTLIHEFQHLLNFCTKRGQYSTWFTEMLAMSAEDVFQTQIDLSEIDSPKSRFDITFNKPYIGFKDWPATDDDNVYYAYANSYAFGAYLMRNYGGIDLINLIATIPYSDEEAVTKSLQMLGYNETFESVFKKFGAVYVLTEKDSSLTLNKDVKQSFNNVKYELTSINLSEYIFNKFDSLDELRDYVKTNLYNSEFNYYNGQKAVYLAGPEIYNSSYKMSEPINPYGFTVFYAGKVQSGQTLSVNRDSKLSITLVLK